MKTKNSKKQQQQHIAWIEIENVLRKKNEAKQNKKIKIHRSVNDYHM